MKNFEIGEHTADLELRVRGRKIEDVFLNAARAVLSYTAPGPETAPTVRKEIHLTAPNREELLVDWLNEILYLQEMEGTVFRSFEVRHLTDREVRAVISGGKAAPGTGPEIKAATYHDLYIKETPSGWEAHVILDL